MNLGGLSLEQAPGFWIPLRFFLSVPVFGIIAAVILLLDGGQLFQSRWQPASLAVTHALTLGYIGMGMLGALFQMLPVVMGAVFPRAEPAAVLVHLLVAAGTVCLLVAFITGQALLFTAAVIFLLPVLALFAGGVLIAVWRAGNDGTTARAVQFAALALIVTTAIGGYLAGGYAFDGVQLQRGLTNYHAAWGLVGWISVLVIGISAQVIPMFLTTPPYPRAFNKLLVYLLMLSLCAGSVLPVELITRVSVVSGGILMTVYAAVTLYLLMQRRRKRFDVTEWFWRIGMLCLIAGSGVLVYSYSGSAPAGHDLFVVAGVLLLAGFAVSIVNGMLYKIVPFLVWLNLRMPVLKRQVPPGTRLYTPNVHEVIGVQLMKLQLLFHGTGLVMLLATVFSGGSWVYAAAAMMLVSNLLLLLNLARAVRIYQKYSSQATPAVAGKNSCGR